MKILTDSELAGLSSMSNYWDEVGKREDQSPLTNDVRSVCSLLGAKRLLMIVSEYVKQQKTNAI